MRWFWCTRGGLVTMVRAGSVADARSEAGRAFRRGVFGRWDDSLIRVRRASRVDRARWDALIAQQEAGVAGACVEVLDDPLVVADGQGDLFS